MPIVQANGIDSTMRFRATASRSFHPVSRGRPGVNAFQTAERKDFTCFTVDLRGAGLSSKPEGTYTTELLADDIAAFMQVAGIDRAHVSGLSLGAATGMRLGCEVPGTGEVYVAAQRSGCRIRSSASS